MKTLHPQTARTPTRVAILLATGALLLASAATAKTKGTGTPSPFSPATTACIKQAALNQKGCKFSLVVSNCVAQYQSDYANCFAAGKGVTCATTCLTAKSKCETAPLAAGKTCVKTCKMTEKAAAQACQGNLACLASATSGFITCKKACAQSPGLVACKSTFTSCIAKCPNL